MLTRSTKLLAFLCKKISPKRKILQPARPFIGEAISHSRPRGFFSVQRSPARAQIRTITYSTSPMTTTNHAQAVVGACDFPRTAVVGFCGIPFSRQFSTARTPWHVPPPSPHQQRNSPPARQLNVASHVLANLQHRAAPSQVDQNETTVPKTSTKPHEYVQPRSKLHMESRGFGDLIVPRPSGGSAEATINPRTVSTTRRMSLPVLTRTGISHGDTSGVPSKPTVEIRRRTTASQLRKQPLDPPQTSKTNVCLSIDLKVEHGVAPDQAVARLDATFLQSVTLLAERSRNHYSNVITILKRLLPQQGPGCRFQVTLDGSLLRLFFPRMLFSPQEPSKEQALHWLAGIGVDTTDPALQLIYVDKIPSEDNDDNTTLHDIIGPEYFQGIQSFLEHVDALIEHSAAFGVKQRNG